MFQWYSPFSEDHFKDCHPNVSGFDECVREELNAIRPYFKTGLPQYNVDPIDPFFAKEVSVSRGMPNLGFTLTLKNVTESGWVKSKVTKFVSDFTNYRVRTDYIRYLLNLMVFMADSKILNFGKSFGSNDLQVSSCFCER